MVAYFDTSLLFNIYVPQSTGTQSVLKLITSAAPVVMTGFGYTELRNAMRLCRFRQEITEAEFTASLDRIDRHLSTKLYDFKNPNWTKVYEAAENIGAQVTVDLGIRGMDLMHLAVAFETGATDFHSADRRQCDAAKKIGLTVHLL